MRAAFITEPRAVDDAPNRGLLSRLLLQAHLDGPLLIGLFLITLLGLVVLYSAGRQSPDMLFRQGVRLGLGFVAMVIMAQFPPRYLRLVAPWMYLAGAAMLVAVLAVGEVGKGAQRWLNLGVVRFQPSEIMKVAVPMMMAWFFADKPLPPSFRAIIIGSIITVIPVALIIKQPDLGTSLLVGSSGGFALFLAGLSWRLILGMGAAGVVAAPLFWSFGMRDYQRQRVLTFLDPESDPLGSGWNIIQSKIAIGSGGVYGKGWLNGTQSHLDFLPEGTTDFIFAVFAEEFGLVGLLMLLVLYFFIISRSLFIAAQAPDTFSRVLAGSLALIFFVYVFVNAGMVSGILPVVGLPLPLISYGGTSIVTIMAGFGMLMSIRTHARPLSR